MDLSFYTDEDLSYAEAKLVIKQNGQTLAVIGNGLGTRVLPEQDAVKVHLSEDVGRLPPLPGQKRVFDIELWIRKVYEKRNEKAFKGTLILAR